MLRPQMLPLHLINPSTVVELTLTDLLSLSAPFLTCTDSSCPFLMDSTARTSITSPARDTVHSGPFAVGWCNTLRLKHALWPQQRHSGKTTL